ncbi:glycosyltransferase family 9 protein [Candidatus Pacearchaeota archaeon]|nr:glycosyltransferase family 9 protein [Candidatus Pacearchaeota archaeon]
MHINKGRLISAILTPLYILLDYRINKKRVNKKNKKILLIFLGEIGDYILFRNFIEEIKKNLKYRNYSITLCGNLLWKNISEELDADNVDKFIWIDRKKFLINFPYRFNLLKKIHNEYFEIVLQPTYGRSFYLDSIIKVSNSFKKIGNRGGPKSMFSWQKKISDNYYTRLISSKNGVNFEFFKNKGFFENFLNRKINRNLSMPFKKKEIGESYVVFVPGAGAKFRRWSTKNFAEIADFIIQKKKKKIKILGSRNDSELAKEIISHSHYPDKIENLTGNTLLDSINIIGNSDLLVSNETGTVHISAATNTLTLCVSNGNQFGNFHPYPSKISKKIHYVYPPDMENKSFEELTEKYSTGSSLDINLITAKKVIEKLVTIWRE